VWLFSYGSNGPGQLAERLVREVACFPAFARHHRRVYVGHSSVWEGAVASPRPARHAVYGSSCQVTAEDLALLDRYEGVAVGRYQRSQIFIQTKGARPGRWTRLEAVCYLATSEKEGTPSAAYLDRVRAHLETFWREGSVQHPEALAL